MKTYKLSSGFEMPAIGLGTWKATAEEITHSVSHALNCGYQHLDCAAIYWNEPAVGRMLSASRISREDLFITSKLWNSFHAPDEVKPAIKQSLHDLKLTYLDLYLMHWPVAFNHQVGLNIPKRVEDYVSLADMPLSDTWQAMEALVDEGLVRSIGLANFSMSKIKAIIDCARIKPSVNQVECHPYLQQNELLAFCKNHDIHLTAYSPLGTSDNKHSKDGRPSLLMHPVIQLIAQNHQATAAQIILAWQLMRGISVIPKSSNQERIAENFQAIDIVLTPEEMGIMAGLNDNYRYLDGHVWMQEGSPYRSERFWD